MLLREIWNNFTEEQKSPSEDEISDVFEVAIRLFDDTFALKENVPKSRAKFWESEPHSGETINNFITRLKALSKNCRFKGDGDDHVRDKTMLHIRDTDLKAKLFRNDDLTLGSLIQTIGTYHHKEALILNQTSNTLHVSKKSENKNLSSTCFRCGAQGHFSRECIRSRNHTCRHCGKKGHLDDLCYHKNQPKPVETPSKFRNKSQSQGGHKQYVNRSSGAQRNLKEDSEDDSSDNHFFI